MKIMKFRGRAAYDDGVLKKGEWVYGYYIYNLPKDKHRIYTIEGAGFDVDPETVGQFVGLLDKNEKEIYRGDLVQVGKSRYVEVEWLPVNPYEGFSGYWEPFRTIASMNWEIVGNVFENPKLIKLTS